MLKEDDTAFHFNLTAVKGHDVREDIFKKNCVDEYGDSWTAPGRNIARRHIQRINYFKIKRNNNL